MVPFSLFYKYNRKSRVCIASFYFKGRRPIPDCLSRMPSLVIIHITSAKFLNRAYKYTFTPMIGVYIILAKSLSMAALVHLEFPVEEFQWGSSAVHKTPSLHLEKLCMPSSLHDCGRYKGDLSGILSPLHRIRMMKLFLPHLHGRQLRVILRLLRGTYSSAIRKVMYNANAIKSVNSSF